MRPWHILAAFVLGACLGAAAHRSLAPRPDPVRQVDTLIRVDTITTREAVVVERRVVDSVLVPVVDTAVVHDTLFVVLPREAVTWADSLCTIYASGIQARVDSVVHYIPVTEVRVVERVQVPGPAPRWSLGVQAGLGASSSGLVPYVGIGLSYALLSW